MKDKKRMFLAYSFLDYDGIAAHMEKMSEKGWLFEGVGPFCWVYRRVEPRRRSFYVSYFPKASEYDPGLGEEQQEFADFCARTGWRLAGTAAQMQIFYNESADPVPIETDPGLEVETINRAARKNYLPAHFLLLALAIFEMFTQGWRLFTDPLDFLSKSSYFVNTAIWLIALVGSVVEITSYFLWLRRARKAAEVGEWTRSLSHRRFQIGCLTVVGVGVAAYIFYTAARGDRLLLVAFMLMAILLTVGILVTWGVKSLMKRFWVPTSVNRTVTILTAVALSVAIVSFAVFALVGFGDRLPWIRGAGRSPLTAAELYGDDREMYEVTREEGTFLISRLESTQRPDAFGIHGAETLEYTVYTACAPALRDFTLRELLEKNMKDAFQYDYLYLDHYDPVDPAPWQADQVYRRLISWGDEGEVVYMNCWFLIYGNTVVELKLGSEPTQAQMNLIAERLGNVKEG